MIKPSRLQILVCDGPSCGVSHDSEELLEHGRARVAATPTLCGRVHFANFTCFGRCGEGPNLMVRPLADDEDPEAEPDYEVLEGVRGLYLGMDSDRLDRVLAEHCETGVPIDDWAEEY